MALKHVNRARMTTATTGTGTMTLGSAVGTGPKGYYQSFAAAGVVNADTVRYTIEDGAEWEIGIGTYTSSGTTLSRDTVMASSNAGAKINLSGSAEVYVTLAAEDLDLLAPLASPTFTGTVVVPNGSFANANLADMAANTFKMRKTASTGAPEDATVAEALAVLGLGTTDNPQFGSINLGHASDTTLARIAAGRVSIEGKEIMVAGSGRLLASWMPTDNEPPASNYALFGIRNLRPHLAFDTTTGWTAVFPGRLPDYYGSGGITATIIFRCTSATTGTVGFTGAFERVDLSSLDTDTDSYASSQTFTAITVPGTAGQVIAISKAFTDGGQIDSIAAGELFRFSITRDVANDTAAGNAEVVAVYLKET